MGADECHIDSAGNHRLQRRVCGLLAKTVEASVFQVRDARRELQADHRAEGKHVIGIATTISVVLAKCDFALVVE